MIDNSDISTISGLDIDHKENLINSRFIFQKNFQ